MARLLSLDAPRRRAERITEGERDLMREDFAGADDILVANLRECRAGLSLDSLGQSALLDDSLATTRLLIDTYRGLGRTREALALTEQTFRAYVGTAQLKLGDERLQLSAGTLRNLFMLQLKRGSILEELDQPDSARVSYDVAYDLSQTWVRQGIVNPRMQAYGSALRGRAEARTAAFVPADMHIAEAEAYFARASDDKNASGWMRHSVVRTRVEYWIAVGELQGFASRAQWDSASSLALDLLPVLRNSGDRRELRKLAIDLKCLEQLEAAIGHPGGRCAVGRVSQLKGAFRGRCQLQRRRCAATEEQFDDETTQLTKSARSDRDRSA